MVKQKKDMTKAELLVLLEEKEVALKDKDVELQKLEVIQKESSGVAVEDKVVDGRKYETASFTIRPDEYVEIISLCPTDLYLSRGMNDDNPLKFEKLGESKHVLYSELVAFINNHSRFTRDGIFYIVDERIVKRHGLVDFYDEILTKEEIAIVMESDSKTAIKLFNMTNKNQQEYLSDMFIKKIVAGEDVDMNMVFQMGKILGTDIAQKAEDAKEFKKLLIKE